MNAALDTQAQRFVAELDHRENDGIEVTLLWNRADDTISVVVYDAHHETAFELIADPTRALDVFNHPYAYAARPEDHATLREASCCI